MCSPVCSACRQQKDKNSSNCVMAPSQEAYADTLFTPHSPFKQPPARPKSALSTEGREGEEARGQRAARTQQRPMSAQTPARSSLPEGEAIKRHGPSSGLPSSLILRNPVTVQADSHGPMPVLSSLGITDPVDKLRSAVIDPIGSLDFSFTTFRFLYHDSTQYGAIAAAARLERLLDSCR